VLQNNSIRLSYFEGDHSLRPFVSGEPETIVYEGDGTEEFVIGESPMSVYSL